jgi:hypothetical protein
MVTTSSTQAQAALQDRRALGLRQPGLVGVEVADGYAVGFPRFTDPRERRGMSALRLGRASGKVWVAMLIGVLAAGCTSAGHDHSNGGRVARPASAGQPGSAKQALADEAARVVREYWRARNLAYSALEMGPLRGFEDQAAAALSQADVDNRLANGLPPDPSSNTSLRDLRTYLTRPDRFPRLLLAAVTAASDDVEPQVYLLTFTRATPEAPWKLSWRARYADNTELPSIGIDADGFAVPLTPAQQRATLLADAAEVGRRLQEYRLRAADAATPPRSSFFADTADTYGAAKDLQNDISRARRIGVDERVVARPPGLPGYALATREGALVMVTVGEQTVRDYRASPLQQDPNQINNDRRISPGSYRTMVFGTLAAFAVDVPAAASHSRAVVVGSSSSVTTVRARP